MVVEGCYILIAWVALLLVGLVGFGITMTLRSYYIVSRMSKDMHVMFLECFVLIALVSLLLVGLVGFVIGS